MTFLEIDIFCPSILSICISILLDDLFLEKIIVWSPYWIDKKIENEKKSKTTDLACI